MKAIPAIDLRDGACVQLVGGSYDAERVRIPDPLEALRRWQGHGFQTFHIVDLDAAMGRGDNNYVIQRLLAEPGCTFSVGGGVRSQERVATLLAQGATRVVVGTRALEEPAWLTELAGAFPGRLVVAADVRGREVVARGWQESLRKDLADVLKSLQGLPLAGVLVTAVHREGQMGGIDLPLMQEAVQSGVPVFASGGVTTLDDLRALARAKAAGAVIGMALYTGKLDPRAVAQEFA